MKRKEGHRILRKLKRLDIGIIQLAKRWHVSRWLIYGVLGNKTKSKRIEDKLRKIGGFDDKP